MSADIIPMPEPREPAPPANITPFPAPPPEDTLSKLLRHPLVIAGGAMLAGLVATRLFSTPSVKKLAHDLAEEALRRARQTATPDKPAAPSLLDEAIESVRPQITDAARDFLTGILKKKS